MSSIDLDTIEARASALLSAAPSGPYEAHHPDDLPGRSIVMGGTETRAPFDAFVVAVEGAGRVAIAEMLAASHGLATQTLTLVEGLRSERAMLAGVRIALTEAGYARTEDPDEVLVTRADQLACAEQDLTAEVEKLRAEMRRLTAPVAAIDLDDIEAIALAATEGVRDDGYRITAPSGEVIVEYKHSEHANAANDGALFGVARANTLTLVHELRRLTAPIAASDLTPEQRAACWQVIDRHKAYLARRGELCTCGSGAHLRECARHPNAYAAHLAELNAQSQADTIAEQDAEIARLTARIADLEALASGPRGDL